MDALFVRRVLMAFALIAAALPLTAQIAFLGMVEDVPGVYAGEPNSRAVRVVFERNGSDWKALPSACPDEACLKVLPSSYPREVAWTVTFDGRNLGRITAKTPREFKFYSHVGLQDIASGSPVPTVGKRSAQFGGFTDAPVYRPLVANAQPYFKDPELWKPSRIPTELVKLLRVEFRRRFPTVWNCADPDESAAKTWAYTDDDIKIVTAYSSKKRWTLARLRLEEYRCDGPADDPFVDQWFAISPAKEIKFLDQGMWLVDAGDYDNDGKSELLFSIDRYNRGGYEVFYDDFKKTAKFEYSYH